MITPNSMRPASEIPDWTTLERRLGVTGLLAFVEQELQPELESLSVEPATDTDQVQNHLGLPLGLGMFGFVVSFMIVTWLTPGTFWGGVIEFLLFFPLFFGSMALSIYLFRDRLLKIFLKGQTRFIARSKALNRIASFLDLTYIPSPGGAPEPLKYIARTRFAPSVLRDVVSLLDDHGGLEEAVATVRRSGVMADRTYVLASQSQKEKYYADYAKHARIEDGFQGLEDDVAYCAFEWVETRDEEDDRHHIVLVFETPLRLQAVTHLRSRKTNWPRPMTELALKPVDIVAPSFEKRFEIRTSDQVEARTVFDPAVLEKLVKFADTAPVRAVAFDGALIIDIEGDDRFALVDLLTGAWSQESIKTTLDNIADMRDLAVSVAAAFRLRKQGQADAP